MTNGPDFAKTLDGLANDLQALADRAVPTANRIARLIKVGGILGLVGGLAGAAALALPGFGFAQSWGFFLLLVAIAFVCAAVVFRWSKELRSWTGDVKQAVRSLHDIPSPGKLVDDFRSGATSLVPAHHGASGRADVMALVHAGVELRKHLSAIPGAAQKGKDLFLQLTGPFRPPFLGVRFGLLIGGLAMVVIGPFLALLASLT
jgi:hypothetical protein